MAKDDSSAFRPVFWVLEAELELGKPELVVK